MGTDDPTRIDRVLALAERVLPLDQIASGSAEEMGFGLQWSNHSNLNFILQELRRFPGKGWPLIRAGIRSPVIRNRHMAVPALSPWGKANWPADAEGYLETAIKEEVYDRVRAEMKTLLTGCQIEDDDDGEGDDDSDS